MADKHWKGALSSVSLGILMFIFISVYYLVSTFSHWK